MNISYDLWPIWCDYLEEQGQNTELLRYCMVWSCFGIASHIFSYFIMDWTKSDYCIHNCGDGWYVDYGEIDIDGHVTHIGYGASYEDYVSINDQYGMYLDNLIKSTDRYGDSYVF